MKKISIFLLMFLLITGCTKHVDGIEGKWKLNNGSIMVISEKEFYWYENDSQVSYYMGHSPTILTKNDAIEAIKVPEENKQKLLQSHIYYLSTTYDKFVYNNTDCSDSLTKEKSEFAFQMNSINKVNIVNLNTNEEFIGTRMGG